MSKSVLLETALSLPACDIEALIQGRMIAVIPRIFINPGRQFALYPTNLSINLQPHQRYYRSSFLTITQTTLAKIPCDNVVIKAWARCEGCKMYSPELFDTLSQLTVWTKEALQLSLGQRPHIFLAYLRVYLLSDYLDILSQSQNSHFLPLRPSLNVSEDNPILTDRTFTQRKHQLENLQPPLHPELEELQSAIASLIISQPAAKQLDDDIKVFLGWSSDKLIKQPDANLAWINDIAKLGDRSIEQDEKKSNYQAGTDFENIARQSLEFLGFKVESAFKGGAGGLDLYCSKPYPIICECKAGKLIPSRTVEELLKLGGMHLGKTQLLTSAKLVIGPGNPSPDTLKAAKEWEVSIINAMTLQKLVEFKAKYPGAINLVELQQYLQPGQIDYKIDEYIDKLERAIKLRSHIIELVKNYLQNSGTESAGVEALHGAYFGSLPPQALKTDEMHEILIELSSPLTGYLGRIKGSDWKSDRFYFLRDLAITLK
ncbi:hypothetical protein VF14_02140 [Nostoc linckia z18]|uniref:DUF1802 family protein n=2 Tax=Nostoc linckia TaxID=92942 RepID=A0A9Q6EN89_NOSLI|nr:DUF1802 family protein [Nostoc linckia]PHK28426.1 hypothetical protein VF12_32885 [Nostoc linckia z15]PHK48243.1 hypothetical protein VF13_01580 [Nostoc linckia z16]PHJ68322.1 hypothetical protein VF02_03170 [Nostoc linckia z1]PHJ73758.1 hypothetical protein VF05_00585 [Nostoc linckia z3]PHJ78327.1 hypothetical protein VF03_01990 [Nostoc linckia z2]